MDPLRFEVTYPPASFRLRKKRILEKSDLLAAIDKYLLSDRWGANILPIYSADDVITQQRRRAGPRLSLVFYIEGADSNSQAETHLEKLLTMLETECFAQFDVIDFPGKFRMIRRPV